MLINWNWNRSARGSDSLPRALQVHQEHNDNNQSCGLVRFPTMGHYINAHAGLELPTYSELSQGAFTSSPSCRLNPRCSCWPGPGPSCTPAATPACVTVSRPPNHPPGSFSSQFAVFRSNSTVNRSWIHDLVSRFALVLLGNYVAFRGCSVNPVVCGGFSLFTYFLIQLLNSHFF